MKNNGITLIALVITIIVLLILVSVSITTLIGENGIITQARNAKEQTEIAGIIEKARVDILVVQAENDGNITQKQLDEILAKYGTVSGEGEDKVLTTDKEYSIKVSDIWSETETVEKILVKDVLKTDQTATEAASKSPYVKYNGLDCRVLYNDDTHGIQIITAESVEDVTLGVDDPDVDSSDFLYDGSLSLGDNFKKAAASYNNAIDNLNKRAKSYMDTKGIVTDARCLGSIPTLTSDGQFQGDNFGMWSGSDDWLTTYSWNNKFKDFDDRVPEDVNQLKSLGLNGSSSRTMLGARFVVLLSSDTYHFAILTVLPEGGLAYGTLVAIRTDGNRWYGLKNLPDLGRYSSCRRIN